MEFDLLKKSDKFEDVIKGSKSFAVREVYEDPYCKIWLKYLKSETLTDSKFTINGKVGLGATPTVMLIVLIKRQNMYHVYRYNGPLKVNRIIKQNLRDDSFENIGDIIEAFLKETVSKIS